MWPSPPAPRTTVEEPGTAYDGLHRVVGGDPRVAEGGDVDRGEPGGQRDDGTRIGAHVLGEAARREKAREEAVGAVHVLAARQKWQ